jgi:quercetin dioxygenase-like cupin family protein
MGQRQTANGLKMEPILKYFKERSGVVFFLNWPVASTHQYRGCQTATLVRNEAEHFLIEQIIFPPNMRLPRHRHPNVSVLDFGISGSGVFSVGCHVFKNEESNRAKLPLYVPRNVPHGGVVGINGAVIVSLQYWHQWPPQESIFLDWEAA